MNKINLPICFIIIVSAQTLMMGQTHAEIYKCENKKGSIYYHDKPCPIAEKETQIKATKDPKNGYVPPSYVNNPEQKTTNKGVVIGNTSERQIDEQKEDQSADEKDPDIAQQGNTDSNGANANSVEKSDVNNTENNSTSDVTNSRLGESSGTTKLVQLRSEIKTTRKKSADSRPKIPLKVEKRTPEPRSVDHISPSKSDSQ